MKTDQEYVTDAHSDDVQWKKDLQFYADEIHVWKKLLAEISSKNTTKDIKMTISHFENQFIIYKEQIDELKHEIQIREDFFAQELKKNSVAFDHRTSSLQTELKGKMAILIKLYAELRNSFQKFLAETM